MIKKFFVFAIILFICIIGNGSFAAVKNKVIPVEKHFPILYFFSLDCANLMFYIFPTMSSILILTQMFKDKLGTDTAKHVRFIVCLILSGFECFYTGN